MLEDTAMALFGLDRLLPVVANPIFPSLRL
jgi:hypothetical protein